MESKRTDMQAIFSQLTEKNKEILIMIAKGMKVSQTGDCEKCKAANYSK